MRVTAFVGASGTGKSYRAIGVAKNNDVDAIIDDGLLIADNTVIAGVSAKREPTRLASVRRALFTDKEHRKEVNLAIKKHGFKNVMILATSDAMADKIAEVLELPAISKTIYIEDVSTKEEIETARQVRTSEGQHVIPVPTFRIKKYFSGYFLHPLRLFQKNLDEDYEEDDERTIVRPTFSYLGQYTISDNVIINIATYEAMKVQCVKKVLRINSRSSMHGVHIDMTVILEYGEHIPTICKEIQKRVSKTLQEYTSINVRRVNILVKNVI